MEDLERALVNCHLERGTVDELVRDIDSEQDPTFDNMLSAIKNLDVEMYILELKK